MLTRTGPRTYTIDRAAFPIKICVEAKSLPAWRVVPGEIAIIKGDVVVERQTPVPAPSGALTRCYAVTLPSTATPPCDILQMISCFFDNAAPTSARYIFTITANSGEIETTSVSPPTINPATPILTFLYR